MKKIKTEKTLYNHSELEKILNIGRNIINERSKNNRDGSLNRYNESGNIWRKGDGLKYYDMDEVKKELERCPYKTHNDNIAHTENSLGITTDEILKDIRELLANLLQGQRVQVKGMLDMRESLIKMVETWENN